MALGLNTDTADGGDFMPIIKYDARAGRFCRRDRVEEAGQWVSHEIDITDGFAAIMDVANIEVGWMDFFNTPPSIITQPASLGLPDKPERDTYKQGFRLHVKLKQDQGGDVREWCSSAKAVIRSVDALHDLYKTAPEAAQGRLPIVAMTGTTIIESGSGARSSKNYSPNFEIIGWADRPPGLAARGAEVAGASPNLETKQAPPATGSTSMPPPSAQPANGGAQATADDFG